MATGNKKTIKKILFYTGNGYGFRSLPMWHVFEMSQVYPVVLLAEKLDSDTEEILRDRRLFPKLEEIIFVKHDANSLKLMIKNNKALYKEAKEVVEKHRPDIIISSAVTYPFPLYLRRIAKRDGALDVCTFSPVIHTSREISNWVLFTAAYEKRIKFLPFYISLFLEKIRKQFGHFLYYWFLPMTVGEKPFRSEPGCVLYKNLSGRSADYYISFLKKDYDISLNEGMPDEKLYNLSQPYPLKYYGVRDSFKERFLSKNKDILKNTNGVVILMWPNSQIGVRRDDLTLISRNELKKSRMIVIKLLIKILKNWKIFIKPHPNTDLEDFLEIKSSFERLSKNIQVVDPLEFADVYTEISDVVIGMPPASVTIYTASLTCPDKIILSVDLNKELLGNGYKNLDGVDYINSENKLMEALTLIRNRKYNKKNKKSSKEELRKNDFTGFVELAEYLFNEKYKNE